MDKNEIISMLQRCVRKATYVSTERRGLLDSGLLWEVLEAEREGEKSWKPSLGQEYWLVENYGEVFVDKHEGDNIDLKRITFGNVFPTREKAQEAADAIKEFLKGRK